MLDVNTAKIQGRVGGFCVWYSQMAIGYWHFPSPYDNSTHSVSNICLKHLILLQLLGELYADKKYLEKLMDDQGTLGRYFIIYNIN